MERESGVTLNHGILTMIQPNWKNPRSCYLLISYIRIRITIFNISRATLCWLKDLKDIMTKAEIHLMDIILVPRFPAPWSYGEKKERT